ncbi:hypothetical protein [Mycolicibacterium chitae]|uniref:Uncharacterized protein n=1 Tax=Mycolicibacterium chitae TaxID=1792 RepID=A0A448I7L6_MYCCI|nr:hypothetical protein [Mycolicibacterium chitae]MCV7104225.1 hypothetical protein [Mycolicibacterium chitae]VEG48517.1 Uncharacterised protein [Mycolicibacterium chitae]
MAENGTTTPQEQRRRGLNKKILIGIGIILALLIVVALATGEDSSDESKADEATTSVPTEDVVPPPAPDRVTPTDEQVAEDALRDGQIAEVAEQYMKTSLMFEGPWSSYAERCLADATLDPARCWQPYVNNFDFSNGILRVTLQVDRSDPFDKQLGENAATHIARFIGSAREVWAEEINWVEIMDGTGVHIAQQQP